MAAVPSTHKPRDGNTTTPPGPSAPQRGPSAAARRAGAAGHALPARVPGLPAVARADAQLYLALAALAGAGRVGRPAELRRPLERPRLPPRDLDHAAVHGGLRG